jgi:asparaginyl-tRNA synthetase
MNIRDTLAYATHVFFKAKQFRYVHTPLITTSDCEGAGEVFHVTTPQFKDSFFGRGTYLTVSGQLQVETYACGGQGDVYTFGPTFRAEKSNTSRHLAEFWMIEPEMVFCELADVMDLAEHYVKDCITAVLSTCRPELQYLESEYKGLIGRLEELVDAPFVRLSYTDAIALLQKHVDSKVEWGIDLSSDQEKWLVKHHGTAVIVHHYPKKIKAFYMKEEKDHKAPEPVVGCLDLLVPGIGELIGGSMREDDHDILRSNMETAGVDMTEYDWYLDLRKYGSVPHGGFGLGFERLVMLCTGVGNIKDTIPFPVFYGSLGE